MQLKQDKMELEIINEQQNPLFNRKEIKALIHAEVIPSKKQVAELLSEKYNVPQNFLRILKIQGKFGSKDFVLNANIYSSKEERDKIENLTKKEIEEEKASNSESEKPGEEAEKSEENKKEENKTPEKQ